MTDESLLTMSFTACRCLYVFQRYSWSKSKIFLHRTEFWTFFALQNFKGWCRPQL